jgi:hypothetical protein
VGPFGARRSLGAACARAGRRGGPYNMRKVIRIG